MTLNELNFHELLGSFIIVGKTFAVCYQKQVTAFLWKKCHLDSGKSSQFTKIHEKCIPQKFCCLWHTTLGKSRTLSVIFATAISCCIHNSVLIGGDAWSENNYSVSAEYTSSTLNKDDQWQFNKISNPCTCMISQPFSE